MINPSADRSIAHNVIHRETLAQTIRDRVTTMMDSPALIEEKFGSLRSDRKAVAMQTLYEREMSFVEKFYTTLNKILEGSYSKILILFDIDETIAQNIYPKSGDETVLRPALLPVLESIQELIQSKIISIGFITTRPVEGVCRDLEKENKLKPLQHYIHPDAIYSTRDEATLDPDIHPPTAVFEYPANTPNSVIATSKQEGEGVDEIEAWVRANNLRKINILQRLRDRHGADTAFCAVDDIYYPEWLDEEKGMYGVRLRDGESAFTFGGLG